MDTASHRSDLVKRLTDARDAYYNGMPIMSDAQYDALEDELRRIDPNNPFFQKVGAPAPANGWQKVRHAIPMGSLNKVQVSSEMRDWTKSLGLRPNSFPSFVVMDKLDGISLSLKYEDRKLVQGLSRGDGEIGEDITRNVLLMQGAVKVLPPILNGAPTPKTVYIRAEIVCKRSDFKTHFPGESNPRNTASGTAKRQSNAEKCKHLTVIAYQLLPNGQQMASKDAELIALKEMGFLTPLWNLAHNADDIEILYRTYIDRTRENLDYDIDGLVIDVNDAIVREDLGDLNGKPRGSVAYKWPQEMKETVLRGIEWQVGNSGRITPVAIFDEVLIDGAKLERASLAGVRQVEHLKLFPGCRILVARRNQVIPRVEANLDEGIENDI